MAFTPSPPNYRLPRIKKRRTPTRVDTILRAALKRYGLDAKIERYRFVTYWSEIVGEELSKRSRPERLRGNTLIVAVKNAAWAQEMSFLKAVILKRLTRYLDSDVRIDDVQFVVQSTPF